MKTYNILEYGAVPDSKENQREAIQAALDDCAKKDGGIVEIPAGTYICDSLRMYSQTTLLLRSGAKLLGNENVYDYIIHEFPEGMESRSDMEMIAHYYAPPKPPIPRYRCALLSIYAEKNISIIGEPGSLIDGRDCFDPDGEEGFRGPHGIYITNCENVTLKGYSIQDTGNFMHQIDNCVNVTMDNISCFGGSDATHLHCCKNVAITNCDFKTGDDCIAGIDVQNLYISKCSVNTSCHSFRIGGVNMLVEDCHFYGPGIYPHRMTIVRGKDDVLPLTEGRHNTQQLITYFSSPHYPAKTPACNWYFRNCEVDGVDSFLHYHEESMELLHAGVPLASIRLENVSFKGIKEPSYVICTKKNPVRIEMKNVTGDKIFADNTPNLILVEE